MSDRPRLVATDLDGTLVRSDGTISDRSVDVLSRVDCAGVPFVIVTGRPPRWLAPVADRLGHEGIAICANGAIEYDLATEQIVQRFSIDPAVLADVVTALVDVVDGVSFSAEHGETWYHEDVFHERWRREDAGAEVVDRARLVTRPATKLLAWSDGLASEEIVLAAAQVLGDDVTITHSMGSGLLEISAQGVTKASGLARIADRHGVDVADVVAFGDMPNDLPMLSWAGRSYAVANALPEVRSVADETVASNDDDGVARTLERWF